jgi:CRP/FNR family transcriptional regulator, anaerobic regulatory protein
VNRLERPAAAWRAADDGDDIRFCSTCAFSAACLGQGMHKGDLRDLHVLVEHVGPLAAGSHLFREGDAFNAIAAVREGTVKTWRVDRDGREQVLGFHLPGEVIGLSAIDGERYPCNADALESVQLCRLSFTKIAMLATRLPGLQRELFRLLSRDITHAERLAADLPADARLAGFLLDLSTRLSGADRSIDRLRLAMPRADIANYLRLAPETVSRLFRRFRDDALVRVRGREIEIVDRGRLQKIAEPGQGD